MRTALLFVLLGMFCPTFAHAQTTLPMVAIHDSELTRAFENMNASGATPSGAGTSGKQWWPTNWHYWTMPDSMKEAMRSDGTAYTVIGDSNIVAGGLLSSGQPKYPIVISLAAEAIQDEEIAQFTNYVAAGGFLFVGSSSFTRNTNGTTRGNFAFPGEMGVNMSTPGVTNWINNTTISITQHRLTAHIPTNTSYVNWAMPSGYDEVSWGTYPRPAGDSTRPALPHWVWLAQPTNGATALMRGDTFPSNPGYLVVKQYGKGYFIYYAPMQPLIGHGGWSPAMYAYMIFKNAINWAFESNNIPLPKISPWPYDYNAAFMVRHDLENYDDLVNGIAASAGAEYTNGAKGDYYFTTGTLREDMAGLGYNTNTVIGNLRSAMTNFGATIGPHNGGLPNPNTNGPPALNHSSYNFWHWSTDEALDTTQPGYASGKAYAMASLSNAFVDIENWLPGLMTNGMRTWVAPYFNSTREDSYDIQRQLGVKIAGEQKLTPFPHWTLSYRTNGMKYSFLSQPVSDWFYQLNVAQRMEDVPSTNNVRALIDFYYGQGALINFYSHMLSMGSNNVHGGGSNPLPLDYIQYALNTNLHPNVWSANAIGVYQWWLQRSNVTMTASYSTNGNQSVISCAISGSQSTNTAVEILLPGSNSLPCMLVYTNGALAGANVYRTVGQILRVKVGTAVTNVVFNYGCGFGFTENFDNVTAPNLPGGWSTSASGSQSAWYTTNATVDSSPNAAFCGGASSAGVSELVTPTIVLPTGQAELFFRQSYNLQSGFDGGVLEIKIGTNAFTDILTAGGSFDTGGYNATLSSGTGSALGGRQAWTGNSGGFISTIVDLPLSAGGQIVQLKWRCATDNSTASAGWRIDSIAFTNSAPILGAQTNRSINEGVTLTVTNSATDWESPPQSLTYQFATAPGGASISTNGVITWTTTEADGPSTNTFTTIVTDNGIPAMSTSNTFTVVVLEVNSAPSLPAQTNRTILETTSLTVTNTASDSDVPANPLTYTLTVTNAAGVVTNASISPSGVITWTPTEAQGPSTNNFMTVVADTNSVALSNQRLFATNFFTVVVTESNSAPSFVATPTNRMIGLTTMTVTNSAIDPDIPANNLSYTLTVTNIGGAAVTNASVSSGGVITWTPTGAQDHTTNIFTTVVQDSNPIAVNSQNLSATNSFTVTVHNGAIISLTASALVAESCVPTNNAIDPGETVTVSFALRNTGFGNTTNLVATLLVTNGVAAPSAPQAYGVLIAGGASVTQSFSFSAVAACGSNIAPVLQLQDGPTDLGTVSTTYQTGTTNTIFSQNFDGVTMPALPSGWTTSASNSASPWFTTNATVDTSPNAAFSTDANNIGVNELVSPAFVITVTQPQLRFRNNYDLEYNTSVPTNGYDGGVLEIKIGTNNFTDILTAGGTFTSNGYNAVIDPSFGNPLTNRRCWSGTSAGYLTTVASLPSSAIGQTVQLKWRCGADNGNNRTGWRIDTVTVSGLGCCSSVAPTLPSQTNRVMLELATLLVTNTVVDPGSPVNPIMYLLVNPPAGASINTNGVITYTPDETQGPGTNTIMTAAINSGVPSLSVTNSFTVTISEVNTNPVLPALPNLTVAEQTLMTVTNTASDSDVPANPLGYVLTATNSLGTVITNASISPAGIITWTPTENQGPSTNTFITVVTDTNTAAVNTQNLSATNVFTVVVTEINIAPILGAQTNRTINELTSLVVTNVAMDNDVPANALGYSLTVTNSLGVIITNAGISPAGVITWTPAEEQGPTTNTFITVVTDTNPLAVNSQNLTATNVFTVVVNEVNIAPVLLAQTNRTINELTLLTVTNSATDTDIPANALGYVLTVTNALGAAVTNASISPAGIITWTPAENQGPSTNTFITFVTDTNPPAVNAQNLSATNVFTVVVNEANSAPVFAAQTNRTINELTLLTVTNTATDSDIPANTMGYVLTVTNSLGAVITNASISPAGVITWTPAEDQGPSTNTFITVVTDTNTLDLASPNLNATNVFTVVVNEVNTAPSLSALTNQTINELTLLNVTNAATDADIPANALGYALIVTNSLGGIITNASISPAGVITWTPAEDQGPSTNIFITVVTDTNLPAINSPSLSATNVFTVVVREVNTAPVLPAQTNLTVAEGTLLTVTNTASDGDIPANSLGYTLTVTNSLGATITNASVSAAGVITWTLAEDQGATTNTFITVVTDTNLLAVNTQNLSATNVFTVVVGEVNTAPALGVQTNRTINELTLLTVTNSATDSDLPPNPLGYALTVTNSLGAVITNASISPAGVITWTPAEDQGPGTNTFITVVTDTNLLAINNQNLSATNVFTVVVRELNSAPVLPAQTNLTVNELSLLTVTNTATDSDVPANPLGYVLTVTNSLGAAVTNASISPAGVITWTPAEDQGPSTNTFVTVVTDTNALAVNTQNLSATNVFTVVVREVNSAPSLSAQTNRTINELSLLTVTNSATDSDIPANALGYALTVTNSAGTVITNASISPAGVITWTPAEDQGPSTNTFVTVVTDTNVLAVNAQNLSATNVFTVVVAELNAAPILNVQTNRTINELTLLIVTNTATDSDVPANPLGYALTVTNSLGAVITNAAISPAGVITWTPAEDQGPSTNTFITVVTDTNLLAISNQNLTATNVFTVVVREFNTAPVLPAQTNLTVNELALLTVTNTASDSDVPANPIGYVLSVTNSLGVAITNASISPVGVITWIPAEDQGPSTNTFVTVVTDTNLLAVNSQNLSATNVFTVIVREVNSAPALAAQTNRTINELTLLTVTNSATDGDVPANPLGYALTVTNSLGAVITNASISPSGVITWTPAEDQGPSTNTFITIVTDTNLLAVNSQNLSATNVFTVVVNELNTAPSLSAQTNYTINELALLSVTNTATDSDIPANALGYVLTVTNSLGVIVTNASISPSGVINWTPSENQGPSTNTFVTIVTDTNLLAVNAQNLSATNVFTVVVRELNSAPVLPAQTNLTINELTLLTVTNTATDSDLPANPLGYVLTVTNSTGAVITNAAISPAGVITWTPAEGQGPSTNTFVTVVTDTNLLAVNAQNLSATNVFTVVVSELNSAPVLPAQTNLTINELTLLTVTNTATDSDLPANPLGYVLTVTNSTGVVITNAAISPAGVITWTPGEDQGPSTNTFITVVTDTNLLAVNAQNLSATNIFTVVVNEVNSAPVLPAQTNHTITETLLLTVTNTASDSDLPANALGYILTVTNSSGAVVTNASISPSGVITWTPTETQGPSTNTFITVVTDTNPLAVNAQNLTATNVFTVVVREFNSAPVLPAQTNLTINELTLLTVTNTATDSDIPANPLGYVLTVTNSTGEVITNAAISPTGVISWTPGEDQGPSTNTFITVVTDTNTLAFNSQNRSATNVFTVVVNELNSAPVLPAQTDLTINELALLTVTNTATDSDLPANALAYALTVTNSTGAVITNASISSGGIITWTPGEEQGPTTNTFITVVTDTNPLAVNSSSLSATNVFTVVVGELNTAPSLPSLPDVTINEQTLLSITNTATNLDTPPNPVGYTLAVTNSLGALITNATISSTGIITWTPSENQGPSTNTFITVVTDTNTLAVNAQNLSATNVFVVVVNEVNTAPTLPVLADLTVNELVPLTVTNSASDLDSPANPVGYTLLVTNLAGAVVTNASISPAGIITWTPGENQGPNTYTFITVVTDTNILAVNAQNLSATNVFTVVVNELNTAPSLPGLPDLTIYEFDTLSVTNTATDTDIPANPLTYSLLVTNSLGAIITNATISPSGIITWTPDEAQGPSTNIFITVVTDTNTAAVNTQSFNATNVFTVVVNELNTAPTLPVLGNLTLSNFPNMLLPSLVITNTGADTDSPAQLLSYAVTATNLSGLISDVSISSGGVITWAPAGPQDAGTYGFVTVVTDNGIPALSATNYFTVTITAAESAPPPVITGLTLSNGFATVTWTAAIGRTYRLQHRTNCVDTNWVDVVPDVTAASSTASQTDNVGSHPSRFYRVQLLP